MPRKRKARAEPISIDLCADDEDDGTAAAAAAIDATKPAAGRRSSRIASQARKPDAAVLLHFPSEDAKERITLTYADVRRLKSGARGAPPETLLLNDNLVDLYIKYLSGPPQQLCVKFIPGLDEKSRSRVHMFSAFFLKRLKTTITKGLSMHTMMKWVRDVDLLAKDFLFVPVHEQRCHGHWALAVICFPGLVTRPPPPPPSAEPAPLEAGVGEVKREAAAEVKHEVQHEVKATVEFPAGEQPPERVPAPLPATLLVPMTDLCAGSAASAELSAALPQHGGPAAIDGGSSVTTAVSVGCSSGSSSSVLGGSSGSEGSGGEGSGASGTARAARRGAPCILFFDSFLQNENKVLFTHLRAFLEFYWARQFESRLVEGYPRSGRPLADEPLPPPNEPPCVPPPQPPTRPKRARAASSSDGGAYGPHATRRAASLGTAEVFEVLGRRRASLGLGGAASEPIDADACADPLVDAPNDENSAQAGRPRRRAAKQSMQRMERLKSEEEAWREVDLQQEGRGVVIEGARPLKAPRRTGCSSGGGGGSSGGGSSGGSAAAATPNPDTPVAVATVAAAASADAASAWAAGTLAKRQRRTMATARTEAAAVKEEEAAAVKARREFEAHEATEANRQVARSRRGNSAPVATSTTVPAMAPREATGDAQAPAMAPGEATGDALAAEEGAEDMVLLMMEEGPAVETMMAAEEGAAEPDTVGAPEDNLEVQEDEEDDEAPLGLSEQEELADAAEEAEEVAAHQSGEGEGEACGEDEDEPDRLYEAPADVASAAGAVAAFDADTIDVADGDAAAGGGGGSGSGGGDGVPAAAAAAAMRPRAPKQTWFSTDRMPNIILKKVPQQKNDYDCGLYMLTFIEQLAAAESLPSFETADGLIAHFSGATLPKQEAIDEKRANFYKGVFKLAEAQSQPDDPIVHSDWDGEELEEPRPGKRQRSGRAGALADDGSSVGAGGTGDPAVPVVTSVE